MKYKIKFHCKIPWQTRIECSRQILIPHDWHCPVDFGPFSFSVFVWKVAMYNWHLLLSGSSETPLHFRYRPKNYLHSQLHAGCQAIQTSSLYMWKSHGFCQIPAEVISRCAWNIWIIFKTRHGFPIASSCIQHIW